MPGQRTVGRLAAAAALLAAGAVTAGLSAAVARADESLSAPLVSATASTPAVTSAPALSGKSADPPSLPAATESATSLPRALPSPSSAVPSPPPERPTASAQPTLPGQAASGTTPAPDETTPSPSTTAPPGVASPSSALSPEPAEAVVKSPSASVGAFDCAQLTVEVTLDNTTATEKATYSIFHLFVGPLRDPPESSINNTFHDVAPGEVRSESITLKSDALNTVEVQGGVNGEFAVLATAKTVCGQFVDAAVGTFDCQKLSVRVSLDNTFSKQATRFAIAVSGGGRPSHSETVDLPAGAKSSTTLTLVNNAINAVRVTVGTGEREAIVGEAEHMCGLYSHDPRASFGEVDCSDLTVVLTLDNSRSTDEARYGVPTIGAVVVSARNVRTLLLHLPPDAEELNVNSGADLASTGTTQCTKPELPPPYSVDITVSARSVHIGDSLLVTAKCRPDTIEAQVVLSSGGGIDDVMYAQVTLTMVVNGAVRATLPVFANSDLPAPRAGPALVAVYCNQDATQGALGMGSTNITITNAADPPSPPAGPGPQGELALTGHDPRPMLIIAIALLLTGASAHTLRLRWVSS